MFYTELRDPVIESRDPRLASVGASEQFLDPWSDLQTLGYSILKMTSGFVYKSYQIHRKS
jgi:hypothetical protein